VLFRLLWTLVNKKKVVSEKQREKCEYLKVRMLVQVIS